MHSCAYCKALSSRVLCLNHYILFSQSFHVVNKGGWENSLALGPFPLLALVLGIFFCPSLPFPSIHSQPGRLVHIDVINIPWWILAFGWVWLMETIINRIWIWMGEGPCWGRWRCLVQQLTPSQFRRNGFIPSQWWPSPVATLCGCPRSPYPETLQA